MHERTETPQAIRAGAGTEASQRARILVIDDDISVVNACKRMLKVEYDMSGVSDSRLAVELLQCRSFDLVLCDVRMPGLSGLDVIERVSAHQAARFIFLTGGASAELQAILDRLPNPTLDKPFDPLRLRELIASTLQALRLPM